MVLIMDENSYHGCKFIRWMLRRQPLQGKCEARMNADVGAQGKKSLRIAEKCVTIDPRTSRSQAIKHQDSSTANGLVLFCNEEERLEFF